MQFARIVFLIAGLVGVVVIGPLFLLEGFWGRQFPPAVAHPEFYYGFVGVVFVWQLAYLLIASDPTRYRPFMLLAALAKGSFGMAIVVLFALGRVSVVPVLGGGADLAFVGLFVWAYIITRGDDTLSRTG